MTDVRIELAPLLRPPHGPKAPRPVDRAYAEAGRTLFGLAGVNLILFPEHRDTSS